MIIGCTLGKGGVFRSAAPAGVWALVPRAKRLSLIFLVQGKTCSSPGTGLAASFRFLGTARRVALSLVKACMVIRRSHASFIARPNPCTQHATSFNEIIIQLPLQFMNAGELSNSHLGSYAGAFRLAWQLHFNFRAFQDVKFCL